jgi:TIR domain-containing protein
MVSKRVGLLIATTGHVDPLLPSVPDGSTHISDLADVLQSPQIGGFSLTVLIDANVEAVRSAIVNLLTGRNPDDTVLLYISGHCIRQTADSLFLALRQSSRLDLENTALPAAFVRQQLQQTAANKQLVILDSLLGSVVSAAKPVDRDLPLNVGLNFRVANRRQAVLAASDYLSFCLVGEYYVAVRSAQPPLAASIVRGLRTRAADEKGDRQVTVTGLLNYLKSVGSTRKDEMRAGWVTEGAGDLVVAVFSYKTIGQVQERATANPAMPMNPPPAGSSLIDDNVKFTAYRPAILAPGKWRRMMVFMHLDDPSILAEIETRARQILGVDAYGSVILGERDEHRDTMSTRFPPQAQSGITLVPEVPGIRFNPHRRSFTWTTGMRVHAESFFMHATRLLPDKLVSGRVSVFFGQLLLAEIGLDLRVTRDPVPTEEGWAKAVDKRFRKVFVSYSSHDLEVVEAMEQIQAIGYEYLRKVVKMRSGEYRSERLLAMIPDADVFQLFWSRNAAQSVHVAKEWRQAVALHREGFVRPAYWEIPMPEAPDPLRELRFCFLPGIHTTAHRSEEKNGTLEKRGDVPSPKGTSETLPKEDQASALASEAILPGPAKVWWKRIPSGVAILGAILGGCLLILLSINTISRTFLRAKHPHQHIIAVPSFTPSAQATPVPTVDAPVSTTPIPSPTQPLATPTPSPTQPLATPTPSATEEQPSASPSVAPTGSASPDATDSDSPTTGVRRHLRHRTHHRDYGRETQQGT